MRRNWGLRGLLAHACACVGTNRISLRPSRLCLAVLSGWPAGPHRNESRRSQDMLMEEPWTSAADMDRSDGTYRMRFFIQPSIIPMRHIPGTDIALEISFYQLFMVAIHTAAAASPVRSHIGLAPVTGRAHLAVRSSERQTPSGSVGRSDRLTMPPAVPYMPCGHRIQTCHWHSATACWGWSRHWMHV